MLISQDFGCNEIQHFLSTSLEYFAVAGKWIWKQQFGRLVSIYIVGLISSYTFCDPLINHDIVTFSFMWRTVF